MSKKLEPKRYRAIWTVPSSDPFAAGKKVEVEGYYVKHVYATPNPLQSKDSYEKFVDKHTKHYIVTDGFSDWNLPREMEIREIDINTLEELPDDSSRSN